MGKTFIGMATIDDSLNFEDGKLSLDYGTGLQIDSNKKVSIKKNTDSNNALIADENGLYCDPWPIGSICIFASGNKTPQGRGWLICNGQAVDRTTYKDLYNIIGTTWGSGNGTTTFNLPNFDNRFLRFSTNTCTTTAAGLPNITGEFTAAEFTGWCNYNIWSSGALGWTGKSKYGGNSGSSDSSAIMTLNAANSNSIYGASSEVRPLGIQCRAFIKAFI